MPLALAYGMLMILLGTTALAPLLLALPLQPPDLSLGLAVFCCMPTSLSTGVQLSQVGRPTGCQGVVAGVVGIELQQEGHG